MYVFSVYPSLWRLLAAVMQQGWQSVLIGAQLIA